MNIVKPNERAEYKNFVLEAYRREDRNYDLVVLKDGKPYSKGECLSYKIWTVVAHFSDVVEAELIKIEQSENARRKYSTRKEIFGALYKKLDNLSTDVSIAPRDGELNTQKKLIFARVRDIIREVEDKDCLYEKSSDYETL